LIWRAFAKNGFRSLCRALQQFGGIDRRTLLHDVYGYTGVQKLKILTETSPR